MFVRFRQSKTTLQATLLVGRRVDGRVRHEQVTSLGTIKLPLTIDGREAFWVNLNQVLARLGNRIGADAQAKVFGDVHARIPMVTAQERSEYEIELASQEQRVFDAFSEMLTAKANGNESLAGKAMAESATDKRMAEDAARRSTQAGDFLGLKPRNFRTPLRTANRFLDASSLSQ